MTTSIPNKVASLLACATGVAIGHFAISGDPGVSIGIVLGYATACITLR